MNNKEVLINTLRDELVKRGFYEELGDPFSEEFTFDKSFLETVKEALPESQIERMIETLRTEKFSGKASNAYLKFKETGQLKVEPAILGDSRSGIPSLMLSWGNYLHWFRGYHFQISGTHSGHGTVYSGADRLDHALNSISNLRDDYADNNYFAAGNFVFVACFLPVLCYLEQGRKLLESHDNVILNDFLRESGKLSRLHDVCLDDFMGYVSIKEYSTQPAYPGEIYGAGDNGFAIRILDDSLGYGLLTIDRHDITFTTHPKEYLYRTRRVYLPDWFANRILDEDDYPDVTHHNILYSIIIRALLSISGFRADYMCMYPIGTRRGDIKRLDYNLPDTASDWMDIEKYIDAAIAKYYPNEV